MKFEFPSTESCAEDAERELTVEEHELSEERGNLLQGFLKRIMELRLRTANVLEHLSPEQQKWWGVLKSVPIARAAAFLSEGVLGREPGKQLGRGETLKKYALAFTLLARDLRKLKKTESREDSTDQKADRDPFTKVYGATEVLVGADGENKIEKIN